MRIFVQLFSKTLLNKIKVNLAVDFDLNLPKFGKKRGPHEFLEAPFHNYYTPPNNSLLPRATERSDSPIDNILVNIQVYK